jgi:hypothetical protein
MVEPGSGSVLVEPTTRLLYGLAAFPVPCVLVARCASGAAVGVAVQRSVVARWVVHRFPAEEMERRT